MRQEDVHRREAWMTELICFVAAFANTGREQLTRCEKHRKRHAKKTDYM
jgi:hypothetical protein